MGMRRRRKKNRGLRWTFGLLAAGVLAYAGAMYYHPEMLATMPAPLAATTSAPAAIAQPASLQPVVAAPAASQIDDAGQLPLEVAHARDDAARQAREHTLRVQQRLREDQQARKDAAADSADKNVRCINGQKMKRVDNGWVQATGDC